MSRFSLNIRKAAPLDLEILKLFNEKMALETEGKKLDSQTLEQGIRELLTNEDQGFYLIAEDLDRKAVASLAITYEWSDWRNGLFWWIQSVYVREEFRRKGVFSNLYKTVKMRAKKEANVCGVRLYVEQFNNIAQSTYSSLGMKKLGIRCGRNRFSQEGLNYKMCGRFTLRNIREVKSRFNLNFDFLPILISHHPTKLWCSQMNLL